MNIADKNAQAVKAAEHLFNSLDIKLPEETPQRFVNMMRFLTSYNNVSNKEIAEKVNKTFEIDSKTDSKNMVILKNIDAFSLCEHHIALMYDMKISVAYIPCGFVLGLSKVVRLVDMVCKRLQLQEKIGEDILEIMKILTKSNDIAVNIKAKHSCVTARGIQNVSSETVTNHFSGTFKESAEYQNLFLNSLN
ncbi:MAG: GTP cyclohydrolase I [Clostridia bacterium]|nr:GTP cyclohydrolase I [Clostridia bacterium]